MTYRDRILEMLERQDMYRRRDKLDIPEFYVGRYCRPSRDLEPPQLAQ